MGNGKAANKCGHRTMAVLVCSHPCITAAIAVLALICWAICVECLTGLTPGTVERMMNAEVPVGSSRSAIESWFDKHEFEHSYTEDRGCIKIVAGYAGLLDQLPQLKGLVSGRLYLPRGNAGCGSIMPGRVFTWFLLDRDGRAVCHGAEGEIPMP